MGCARILAVLRRCKSLENDNSATPLARCLGLFDLTFLGIGSTLGLGVYVLAGSVAKKEAGPAVTLSFLVAAIASAFAGLCYAEFASRVPKAGSAYVYSYVSVGEFIAFTIGWNLVLEYVIGTASVAKGMANYIDSLCNNTMRNTMMEIAPMNISFLAKYPDFFAFTLVLLITILLAFGVRESTKLNNVFTVLNLLTVAIVVVAGAIKSNPANWNIPKSEIPEQYEAGEGGFMPWGVAGVMAGAAKCFFGFVGFDCVATTGEEAKNPKRDIPLSIVISLIVIFASYFSIATVLTMMWPYYLQDADAPFPYVFEQTGMPTIKWIVTVGAIFALCTSLLGAMFPLPRVLYAMGTDGVLFRPLAGIHGWTQTPMLATILSGLFAASMAALFDLDQLIDMMSIGTLLAYTIVATSVLFLRYEQIEDTVQSIQAIKPVPETAFSVARQTFNFLGLKRPNLLSASIAKVTIFLLFILALVTCVLMRWEHGGSVKDVVLGTLGAALVVLLLVLYRQPRHDVRHLSFSVPVVPLVPCLSVCMNLYLMVQLDHQTWIRFIVWLVIGYLIYFGYGVRNSSLNEKEMSTVQTNGKDPRDHKALHIGSKERLSLSPKERLALGPKRLAIDFSERYNITTKF